MPIEIDIPYGLNDFARTIMNTDKLGASCTENTANSYKSYINGIYKLYDYCLSGDTPILHLYPIYFGMDEELGEQIHFMVDEHLSELYATTKEKRYNDYRSAWRKYGEFIRTDERLKSVHTWWMCEYIDPLANFIPEPLRQSEQIATVPQDLQIASHQALTDPTTGKEVSHQSITIPQLVNSLYRRLVTQDRYGKAEDAVYLPMRLIQGLFKDAGRDDFQAYVHRCVENIRLYTDQGMLLIAELKKAYKRGECSDWIFTPSKTVFTLRNLEGRATTYELCNSQQVGGENIVAQGLRNIHISHETDIADFLTTARPWRALHKLTQIIDQTFGKEHVKQVDASSIAKVIREIYGKKLISLCDDLLHDLQLIEQHIPLSLMQDTINLKKY